MIKHSTEYELSIFLKQRIPSPIVVVIGVQSSGKSSLINAICGFPVTPTNQSRCTTQPILFKIKKSDTNLATINGDEVNIHDIQKEIQKRMSSSLSSIEITVNLFVNKNDMMILDTPGYDEHDTSSKDIILNIIRAHTQNAHNLLIVSKMNETASQTLDVNVWTELIKNYKEIPNKIFVMNKIDKCEEKVLESFVSVVDYHYVTLKNHDIKLIKDIEQNMLINYPFLNGIKFGFDGLVLELKKAYDNHFLPWRNNIISLGSNKLRSLKTELLMIENDLQNNNPNIIMHEFKETISVSLDSGIFSKYHSENCELLSTVIERIQPIILEALSGLGLSQIPNDERRNINHRLYHDIKMSELWLKIDGVICDFLQKIKDLARDHIKLAARENKRFKDCLSYYNEQVMIDCSSFLTGLESRVKLTAISGLDFLSCNPVSFKQGLIYYISLELDYIMNYVFSKNQVMERCSRLFKSDNLRDRIINFNKSISNELLNAKTKLVTDINKLEMLMNNS
jgi:GTPase Era involved in 16S rRNA processing